MAKPIVDQLKELEIGVHCYCAKLQRTVLLQAPVILLLGDNPMHSELLNHMGSSARKFCRMCMVREICTFINAMGWSTCPLSQAFVLFCLLNFSQHALHLCLQQETLMIFFIQYRVTGFSPLHIYVNHFIPNNLLSNKWTKLTNRAREKDKESKRTEFGIKEHPNPLLDLSVDLYRLAN